MKHILLGLILVCSLITSTEADEIKNIVQFDPVLGQKIILCEIDFSPDSYTLSERAKALLDEVVTRLERIDTETKSIRIEGFQGLQDTASEQIALSMQRAMAVEEYFRLELKADFERFLTGHKDNRSDCRVEINLYDNPWQTESKQSHIASKDKSNGPS